MFFKSFSIFVVALTVFSINVCGQSISRKFIFGAAKAEKGATPVSAADVYSREKGFGFEPNAAVECRTDGKNGGFCRSDKPFYFSAALIDFTAMSKDFYETLGREKSGAAFKEGDATHHNNYGAFELAKMIVAAIKNQNLPLAKFLLKNTAPFDPKKPDAPEAFALPASPTNDAAKPLGK